MPDFTPCTDKVARAFRLYIAAQAAPELADYELVPALRHDKFPIPSVVFAVADEDVKERLRGRGVFDVPLDIYVGTDSTEDPEAVAHQAAAGMVIALLNDKNDVRVSLNRPTTGEDDREVKDFHVFDYWLRGQPTRTIADGAFETVIKLTVVCQGADGQ